MPDRINTPFTNEHFAAFCLSMLGQPYWYGTALHKCSESLRASKARQYPSHYGSKRSFPCCFRKRLSACSCPSPTK